MIHPTLVWHSGPCRTRKVFPHEWTRSRRSATELFHPVVQDLSPGRQTHDGFLCHNRALEGKQMYIHKCLIAFLLTSEEMLDYFWSYVHEVLWVSCVSFYSGVAAENQDTLLSLGGLSKKVHWTPLRACWFLILCSTFFFLLLILQRQKAKPHFQGITVREVNVSVFWRNFIVDYFFSGSNVTTHPIVPMTVWHYQIMKK